MDNMVELWKQAIIAVASQMNCSNEEAARWLMAEFRREAETFNQQEELDSSIGEAESLTYDPLADPDHPMHGWKPE